MQRRLLKPSQWRLCAAVLSLVLLVLAAQARAGGIAPPAPVPAIPERALQDGFTRIIQRGSFQVSVPPRSDRPVDFPLLPGLPSVACADGLIVFTWSVQWPYPTPPGAVGFFSAHQLYERAYRAAVASTPTSVLGRGGIGICRPLIIVNRSSARVAVEIRFLVVIRE